MIAGSPIFVVLLTLAVFAFWLLSVYILLSVRGVKREEMGRLGEMADGVGVVAHGADAVAGGICMMVKGVMVICCNAGRDRVQVCPSPYQVSCPYFFEYFPDTFSLSGSSFF